MANGRGPPSIDGMTSLKVDNLAFRTTPSDLRRAFEKCGEVGDIYIPRDKNSRSSRGFAFVRFYNKRDAQDALDAMDGQILDGRLLRVQIARYARPESPLRQRRGRRRTRSRSPLRRSRSRGRPRRRSASPNFTRNRSSSRNRYDRRRSRSPSSPIRDYSRLRTRSRSRSL